MLKVLNKPYPCNKGIKDSFIISVLIGVFVFLFLLLFKPFDDIVTYSNVIIVGFGLITFSISFLIAAILPLFFKNYFSDENWTVKKEIIHTCFIVFSIGTANFFFDEIFSIHPKSGDSNSLIFNFFLSISLTVIIGFMPVIIVVLYNQTRLLKKYINEADNINQAKYNRPTSTNEIVFVGEGKNEQLKLKVDCILFIKAESNYSEIHYLDTGKTKIELLRMTLTSIEKTLKNFDMFIRVHRSYIVNTNNIEKVSGTAQGYKLRFFGVETLVPVSRSKSSQFKSLLIN